MSLLLDALKPPEPAMGFADLASEAEALDGPATLELLGAEPLGQTAPVEVARPFTAGRAAVAADPGVSGGSSVAHQPIGGPNLSAPHATAPNASALNASAPEPSPSGAGAPKASAGRPIKAYAMWAAVIIAVGGTAMLGKSWWRPGRAVYYPPVREEAQPAAPSQASRALGSAQAVAVPSDRPPDHFAFGGDAPEIDLRDGQAPRPAPRRAAHVQAQNEPAAPARAATPPVAETTLSVTRSEGPTALDRHVQAGYQALAAGDVPGAQTEYRSALGLDANSIDALLGAANAAARAGDTPAALAAYGRVLKLEPGNPDASAASAMLNRNRPGGGSDESRLKLLIAGDDINRPALHAALAAEYAAQARWAEAAQEYFTALGKDPGNPDLAFDVAASLDQNRNAAAALSFYKQALELSHRRPTQIDVAAIEQRIGRLQDRAVVDPMLPPVAP